MEITPKIDLFFKVFEDAVTMLYAFDNMVSDIESPYDEYTGSLLRELRECCELCKNCIVEAKDIYNECWAICKSLDDLPKVVELMEARLEKAIGYAEEVFEREYMQETLDNLQKMRDGDWISKQQYRQICYCLFHIHDFVVRWDSSINDIFAYLGRKDIYREELMIKLERSEQRQVFSKPQQETIENGVTLPIELDTEKAKALLQNAIQKGLCDSNYKWLKTKALLAYFADKASEYLNLGKGEYNGVKKASWIPFETLFGINNLANTKNGWKKTGTLPGGYEDVDKLFE